MRRWCARLNWHWYEKKICIFAASIAYIPELRTQTQAQLGQSAEVGM